MGEYKSEQGSWNRNTKTIRIDINAGLMRASDRQKIKHGMLNTFSHELTHIAEVSGFYDELHSAIVSALEKRGISFNELVEKKKEQLRNNLKAKPIGDEELTYLADVEVIADSCETMLKNSKIFEDIAQSNPNLAQKLKNKLKNFIARLKQLLSKIDALTPEGKLLEECVTDFENIQKLWDKAVTDGIKTINAINAEQKNNTTDNSDVKNSSRYSYNELIYKPDMEITVINDSTEYTINAATRKEIVNKAVKNAIKVGYKNANENAVVKVKDIDNDVIISKSALRHGLDRRLNILAPITLNVGDILQNSIRINEMLPKNPNVEKTYVLIGVAKNQNNEPYIVSFVVNRSTNELTYVDVLYSINTKTEPAGSLSPDVPTKVDYLTGSTISISDLLDYVNKYYPDILPEDVLKHYNYDSRPDGKLGESVLYQSRNSDLDNKYLEAVKNNDMETAQRLVDEAAEKAFVKSKIRDENGKLIKVYHGTDADFTVFDKTKGRSSMDIQGMFFSPWNIEAADYGKKVRAYYLNITNPADERTGYENFKKYKGQYNAGVKARENLEYMGYDGVNNGDEEYIAFNSEQIKSADPVTYDDNGNVIPLSERFNEDNNDIRYQARNSKPDYNFSKALKKEEWASFYSSLEKSNQRNSFRIGDNGILIPDENNSDNYKLVCYEGDSITPHIMAVYKLENYDYNIHDKQLDLPTVIKILERSNKNDKFAKTILENSQRMYGTIFRKYNRKSGRFVKLTRESVSNRKDDRHEPNGTGISGDAEQGVSDNGVKTDFPQFQMRPDNGFANRRMLANALENSVQNNYEKKLLNLYKDNIDQIDELEARLDEVNQKIKKASSVKAADRNREQRTELVKLNNVKKILEDKITRKDKQLLNLESMKPMQKLVETEKKKAYHKARISYEAQLKEVREKRDQAKFRLYFKSA